MEPFDDNNFNISVIDQYQYSRNGASSNSIQADINLLVLSKENLIQISQERGPIQQNPNTPIMNKTLYAKSFGSKQFLNQTTPKSGSNYIQPSFMAQNNIIQPSKQEFITNEGKFKPNFFKPYLISVMIIFILCIVTFVNYTNVGTLITQIFVFLLISTISAYYYKLGIKNQYIFSVKAQKFIVLFIVLIILCFIALIVSISVKDQYALQIINFIVSLFLFFYYYFRVRQYRRLF